MPARRNVAPQTPQQGLTATLATPGITAAITTPAAPDFSKANEIGQLIGLLKGTTEAVATTAKVNQREAIFQKGIGEDAAQADTIMIDGIFDAGPTTETFGFYPPTGLTIDKEDAWKVWATNQAVHRGQFIGLEGTALSAYANKTIPKFLSRGMEYEKQRRVAIETDAFALASFGLVNEPTKDNVSELTTDLAQQFGRDVKPVEAFEKVVLPAMKALIDSGDFKGANSLAQTRFPGVTPDQYSKHIARAYEGMLPSLQQATHNTLMTMTDDGVAGLKSLYQKFNKFTGQKADVALATGVKSYLSSVPSHRLSTAIEATDVLIEDLTDVGSPAWFSMRTEQYNHALRVERDNTSLETQRNSERRATMQLAEQESANLLVGPLRNSWAAEQAMFGTWQQKYPAFAGQMIIEHNKLKTASASPGEGVETYTGLIDSINASTTTEQLHDLRASLAPLAQAGSITIEQFTKAIAVHDRELTIVEGKVDEAWVHVKQSISGEWDTQLEVETSATGYRRVKPEYKGSEIMRRRLLSDMNKEWRAWIRTSEVFEILKGRDVNQWHDIRDAKLVELEDKYFQRIQTDLEQIIDKSRGTTVVRPGLLETQ